MNLRDYIKAVFKSNLINIIHFFPQELKLSNTTLEAKIVEHEKSLQSKNKEITNLEEDNAKLSKEMASATKANGVSNGVHNGDAKEANLS